MEQGLSNRLNDRNEKTVFVRHAYIANGGTLITQ